MYTHYKTPTTLHTVSILGFNLGDRDAMSNEFLPPEWDPIVYQRIEVKEESWPKHL